MDVPGALRRAGHSAAAERVRARRVGLHQPARGEDDPAVRGSARAHAERAVAGARGRSARGPRRGQRPAQGLADPRLAARRPRAGRRGRGGPAAGRLPADHLDPGAGRCHVRCERLHRLGVRPLG